MAAVTLLAVGLRDSLVSPTIDIPGGAPTHVRIAMLSPVYGTDPTLTFGLIVERSFDAGVTWEGWFGETGTGGMAGQPRPDGSLGDGLPTQITSFDGVACTIRATVTVNTPFLWGLTAEVLPS